MTHLSVQQAAVRLGWSKSKVLRAIAAGRIKAERIGAGRTSAWAIPVDQVERNEP